MATFLNDTFTDTDGTALTSHTGETGATWTKHGSFAAGNIIITGNRARQTVDATEAIYYASGTPASADYSVTGVIELVVAASEAHQQAGVVGRVNTAAATCYLFVAYITGNRWRLSKFVAGVYTEINTSSPITLPADTPTTIKLEMVGTTIKGYVNGVEVCSATDSDISAAGKAGIYEYDQTTPTSDVQINSVSAADAGSPTAGALTLTSRSASSVSLSYGTVSGGTAPYSNQLQRSTTSGSGFSNVGSPQTGATATFTDNTVAAGTTYYYRVVSTDSAGTPLSVTSAELTVLTWTTAQAAYVARQFGQFIHFNMSTFENVEWADPADSPNLFNPGSTLNIDQWLDAGKAAGMTYAVLTAKHHDGFCLWPSSSQAHNITASSWYAANGNRNILLEYVTKARGKGLAVGVYFSTDDRRYRADNPAWTDATLTQFVKDQLSEILGGTYGTIDLLWFDAWGWSGGGVGVSFASVPFATIRAHVNTLQPSCVMVVNNHGTDLTNTEIVEFEGGSVGSIVPSGNTLPAETCDTIRTDNNWFWKTAADTPLSAATILADKATINGRSSSYLLNVPPDTTGVIPAEERDRLRELVGDVTAPGTPAALSATPGNARATLHWTANGEADLSGYNVYQSTDNSTYTLAKTVYAYDSPHLGTSVTGLTNGTLYYFKVAAFDYSGNESARTSAATVTPAATKARRGPGRRAGSRMAMVG